MLKHLRLALGDRGVKKRKVNGDIRILVHKLREHIAHGHLDCQLLHAFSHECLLPGLAFFDLAADKFPQQTSCLMRRPAADHEPAVFPYERRCDLCNIHHTIYLGSSHLSIQLLSSKNAFTVFINFMTSLPSSSSHR